MRQVVEHISDAERVFGYRAWRIAAGDPTGLPGWDEQFISSTDYGPADAEAMAAEFLGLRASNLHLLRRIEESRWSNQGIADSMPLSVRAIAFLMAGHLIHHQDILQQRLGWPTKEGFTLIGLGFHNLNSGESSRMIIRQAILSSRRHGWQGQGG